MHKITKGLFFGLCLFFLVKATAQDMTSANPEQKEMTEQEQECKWARDFMYFAFIKEQSYKAISNMGITIELPETYELLSPDTIFQTLSRTCSSTTATEEQIILENTMPLPSKQHILTIWKPPSITGTQLLNRRQKFTSSLGTDSHNWQKIFRKPH